MKKELANIEKLTKFLAKASKYLDSPKKNEDTCYVFFCAITAISETLEETDEEMALTISDWFEENREKFRFCATEDDFSKISDRIKQNTGWICDPDNFSKPTKSSDMTLKEVMRQWKF